MSRLVRSGPAACRREGGAAWSRNGSPGSEARSASRSWSASQRPDRVTRGQLDLAGEEAGQKIVKKQINKMAPKLNVATAEELANVRYIKGPATSVPADPASHPLTAAICPTGTTVVGGGHTGSPFFRVAQSYPTAANGTDPGRQGWTVLVENTFGGGGAADGQAVAICVGADATSGTYP